MITGRHVGPGITMNCCFQIYEASLWLLHKIQHFFCQTIYCTVLLPAKVDVTVNTGALASDKNKKKIYV